MKFLFHASCEEYFTLEVDAKDIEDAWRIANEADGADWQSNGHGDINDNVDVIPPSPCRESSLLCAAA